MRNFARLAALALLAGPAIWGQAVISAHSGMVNFVEGQVKLEGKQIKLDGAIFPDVKVGQTLATQLGRAEILLTPGTFLRLDTNTAFRMVANKLTDTQVEILSGSVLLEVDELLRDNRIVVKMCDSETLLLKKGLYHFNADAGKLRTFDGVARVSTAAKSAELRGGQTLVLGSLLNPDKFNKNKSKDRLYTWSRERNSLLEVANISSARSSNSKGLLTSMWAWDPFYGMYTFLPSSGSINSPFGVPWYSTRTVWIVFTPSPNTGYQGGTASTSSWQGSAPSSVSVAPSSNASTGVVSTSSGSSAGAVAASAGASRGR